MPDRRRIVPDASALIKAYFREAWSDRAKSLRSAIDAKACVSFAPDVLQAEFLTTAMERVSPRRGADAVPVSEAELAIRWFFELPIIYVPAIDLQDLALECVLTERVPAPDCWYVACARHHDAELWVSHDHVDGLVSAARRCHDKVYLLSERSFV